MKSFLIKNDQKTLHKPNIGKSEKRKVQSPFIDNIWGANIWIISVSEENPDRKKNIYIWGADLADMQLISKFNEGFTFLICINYIYSKYAWVIPLKD